MSELEIDLRSNLIQCLTGIAPSSSTQHRLECALTHPPPLRFKKKNKQERTHSRPGLDSQASHWKKSVVTLGSL